MSDLSKKDGEKSEQNLDQIPEALLKKLWNHTGDGEHYQGFYLIYINKEGEPIINARAQNSATDIALRYAIERMVDDGIDETFDDEDSGQQ
jgi:hypothetical protein